MLWLNALCLSTDKLKCILIAPNQLDITLQRCHTTLWHLNGLEAKTNVNISAFWAQTNTFQPNSPTERNLQPQSSSVFLTPSRPVYLKCVGLTWSTLRSVAFESLRVCWQRWKLPSTCSGDQSLKSSAKTKPIDTWAYLWMFRQLLNNFLGFFSFFKSILVAAWKPVNVWKSFVYRSLRENI